MKVHALWYGGYSYAHPDPFHDLELFESVAAAERAFQDRINGGGVLRSSFEFVNRPGESVYCPTVDGSYMHLFTGLGDGPYVADATDCYPDYIIEEGPRGGIKRERC